MFLVGPVDQSNLLGDLLDGRGGILAGPRLFIDRLS
jgi:hypothetical protein